MEVKFIDVTLKGELDNFDITFSSGNIITIIEEYDKTNILNLINGLKPELGQIVIGRMIIDKKATKAKIQKLRKRISFSHNDTSKDLFNINTYEDLKYLLNSLDKESLEEYIRKFNLGEDILSKSYLELSTGEKRKISLISNLISDKEILLFENPTSNLDSKSIDVFTKDLISLKRKDKIVIIVTTDTDFALRVSDKVLITDERKIMMYSDKYTAFSNSNILNKKMIKIPELIQFVDKVNKFQKRKLAYRDDINDIIKDVYRSVR